MRFFFFFFSHSFHRKRDLSPDQQSVLATLNEDYQKLKIPEYLKGADSLDELTNNIGRIVLNVLLNCNNEDQKKQSIDLTLKYVSNPTFLLDLGDELTQKKQ